MAARATAGRYTRVGAKKGPLVIGGAEKKIAEEPDFMYVPLFRVAGPKADVEEWLKENHPDRAKEAIKSCYSAQTLKTKSVRSAFERELENASEARAVASEARASLRAVDLGFLPKLLKIYDEQRRNGVDENQLVGSKSGSDLKAKVKSLASEGKVLDITTMKAKGTETKKMVMKDNSNKRRLSQHSADPFYHVVYNPKNKQSVAGVRNFLKLHGGFEKERITKLSQAVADGEVINISRGKSPTRSPMLSPSRRGKDRKQTKEDLDEFLDDLE